MKKITRRQMLWAIASVGLVVPVGGILLKRSRPKGPLFSADVGGRWVTLGRKYLERFPEEGDAQKLYAELFAEEKDLTASQVVARLRGRIRRDFASRDVVRVAGWVLSRTEAKLAALAALLA